MKFLKVKIAMFLVLALFLLFFGNDFSLIDIEKTAIITALAIDLDQNGDYEVTAQIVVPEANDVNTESKHALLSGTGGTVGAAIKKIGDVSGWFPHLSFCNLLIVGNELAENNVIKVLDYFAKTLRLQGSAMVVLSETKAKDVIEVSTPLDKISSFALQKVLFKSPGFDSDIASINIKTFCLEYYDVAHMGYMPMIKIIKQDNPSSEQSSGNSSGGSSGGSMMGGASGGSGGSSGSSGSSDGSGSEPKATVFSANTTALFKNGVKVGELSPESTLLFNALNDDLTGTTIEVNDVAIGLEQPRNFLLTIIKNKAKTRVTATENDLDLYIDLEIYCKISDQNANHSDTAYSKNVPLPREVVEKTKQQIEEGLKSLVEIERRTECDFLKIQQMLYRHNYKHYAAYKDNYTQRIKEHFTVSVTGQK